MEITIEKARSWAVQTQRFVTTVGICVMLWHQFTGLQAVQNVEMIPQIKRDVDSVKDVVRQQVPSLVLALEHKQDIVDTTVPKTPVVHSLFDSIRHLDYRMSILESKSIGQAN